LSGPDPSLVDRIFARALELDSDERAAWIDAQCGNDDGLRRKVLSLIAAAKAEDSPFDEHFSEIRDRLLQQVLHDDSPSARSGEDLFGQRIGAWRLDRRLARGGLATVYLAHRDDGEYDQRAAFKVLRRGLDTDDLIARFRAERQILSALDHPGIASILDGGALDDGRPYLVLEYVDGHPITEYCRERRLSVRDRVSLMLDVLRALQRAHRHLIVHRDIKPSNILVSNEGRVALLDFGIAKLLDPGAVPGASTLTRTGMSMLTPGYCSPEQFAGEMVTTASDIYQAGAVLFELLTGNRPRSAASEHGGSEAPPPSKAATSQTEINELRGDLDAIVRKAMHTDPDQRYASAEEMEADLRRYLGGRPVLARPDTFGYRLAKLQKRRPWVLPAAGVALLAIAGYVWTLSTYNRQLQIEQLRAAAAQSFLVDMLSSPDPFRPADPDLGSNITVLEALDLGTGRVESELTGDPELIASILTSISRVYASLDEHERAIGTAEKTLAIARDAFGNRSEAALANLQLLARQYRSIDDYEKAIGYFDEQLDIARSLYAEDDPALGRAEAASAAMAAATGEFDTAKQLYEAGIAKMRQDVRAHSQPLINALVALADLYRFDDSEKSLELLTEAEHLAKTLYGEDSLSMALVKSQTASTYSAARRYNDAEVEFGAAIPIYEARLGPDHGATLGTVNNLGILYNRMDQYAEAEAIFREVLERYLEKYGESHRTVADSYQNLATAITRAGRYAESVPMHQRAYELYMDILPAHQPVVAFPLLSKAYAEIHLQRYEDAEATAEAALEILQETAVGTYFVGVARCLVARALEGRGLSADAASLLAKAHEALIGSVVSDTYRSFCRVPAE